MSVHRAGRPSSSASFNSCFSPKSRTFSEVVPHFWTIRVKVLVHVAGLNLGLLLRQAISVGTPRVSEQTPT